MAAPFPVMDDDDDEFDWEAAVQEIDVACQKTASHPPPAAQTSAPAVWSDGNRDARNELRRNSRQSTLDQFMKRDSDLDLGARGRRIEELEVQEAGNEDDERGCCVDIDPEAARTWIYPENVPLRDYQLAITRKALFSNTLVALPTGLGKTLIAAVVMYNYFRWFPEGKIVFAAPSRPLVIQQIEACHNVVGIPQKWTIDMTGQTSPAKRACLWKEKRVFFVTPQVLEKDIQSGTCSVKYLVCLVIDEAHRAMGNYSYCVAVRELLAVPVQLRILALTATPGSKQQTIQQVIDNLQISTLEYRSEDDPDVIPYVHDRKLELIEVPMGQNALDVNSMLLDVIRPMASRLSSMGVLPNRDFQMIILGVTIIPIAAIKNLISFQLSPCDLLNSRDRFRQAPPPDLSHMKYGEVEGYFGVLITLYHIRKLLSSHGIRPAYEMLEEKFKQGSFARLMTRNERVHQMKLLMQRSLTNGAPSPKLLKLKEVLLAHFEKNDPEKSRVIIFSNFRGSVRDIMDALSSLGNLVKPTEFIGQSSGKTLKGQTQKVQQAVLEKFRRGGYNVIVATSIGEEGLDIMEVDLVVCFDANVSPLRMIQRMGRTGRKHDGRVVVLACEGSELKGYTRKQATGKAVRKHMRNGGMNSFNFHPSPRMVPHVFKPEQKCLELSIAEFVPRGKKTKDDSVPVPKFEEKLTDAEALILARFFSHKECALKPSLIAFPQFQAFPSRVHTVKHSSRTGMLIDSMQNLQGNSCAWIKPSCDYEEQDSQSHCAVGTPEEINDIEEKPNEEPNSIPTSPDEELGNARPASSGGVSFREPSDLMALQETSESKKHPVLPKIPVPPCFHSYLFGSEIASVDPSGRVQVASVPILALDQVSFSESSFARNITLLQCSEQVAANPEGVSGDAKELAVQTTVFMAPSTYSESRPDNAEMMLKSQSPDHAEMKSSLECRDKTDLVESPNFAIPGSPEFQDNVNDDELDLSPRLTNFMKSGCVPESPINDSPKNNEERNEIVDHAEGSPMVGSPCRRDADGSVADEACTPVLKADKGAMNAEISNEGGKEFRTPLGNLTNSSCSRDWFLSSTEKSAERMRKFKRLRKIGDVKSCNGRKQNSGGRPKKSAKKFTRARRDKGCQETFGDARDLIHFEAEVSSEADASADEEDEQNDDTYEDSFIDDRVDPTMASKDSQDGEVDMMAIYRRSLLSQSPIIRQQKPPASVTPESLPSASRTTLSPETSYGTESSPHTPQTTTNHSNLSSRKNSVCSKLEKIAEESVPSTSGRTHISASTSTENRKRKFTSHDPQVPVINLEKEFASDSATFGYEPSLQNGKTNENDPAWDFYLDDQFYEGLDLDALEAQAAKLLEEKKNTGTRLNVVSEPVQPGIDIIGSPPSFDLGIL